MNNQKSKEISQQLSAPFAQQEVKFRVGSVTKDKSKGQALAYIDSRTVSVRLDAVVGPEGWESHLIPLMENGRITAYICELSVYFGDRRVTKSDCGTVSGDNSDALKGAASDAFKRAAIHFGVGRYIYSLESPWVPIRNGRYLINPPQLPAWALPAPQQAAPAQAVAQIPAQTPPVPQEQSFVAHPAQQQVWQG